MVGLLEAGSPSLNARLGGQFPAGHQSWVRGPLEQMAASDPERFAREREKATAELDAQFDKNGSQVPPFSCHPLAQFVYDQKFHRDDRLMEVRKAKVYVMDSLNSLYEDGREVREHERGRIKFLKALREMEWAQYGWEAELCDKKGLGDEGWPLYAKLKKAFDGGAKSLHQREGTRGLAYSQIGKLMDKTTAAVSELATGIRSLCYLGATQTSTGGMPSLGPLAPKTAGAKKKPKGGNKNTSTNAHASEDDVGLGAAIGDLLRTIKDLRLTVPKRVAKLKGLKKLLALHSFLSRCNTRKKPKKLKQHKKKRKNRGRNQGPHNTKKTRLTTAAEVTDSADSSEDGG